MQMGRSLYWGSFIYQGMTYILSFNKNGFDGQCPFLDCIYFQVSIWLPANQQFTTNTVPYFCDQSSDFIRIYSGFGSYLKSK